MIYQTTFEVDSFLQRLVTLLLLGMKLHYGGDSKSFSLALQHQTFNRVQSSNREEATYCQISGLVSHLSPASFFNYKY